MRSGWRPIWGFVGIALDDEIAFAGGELDLGRALRERRAGQPDRDGKRGCGKPAAARTFVRRGSTEFGNGSCTCHWINSFKKMLSLAALTAQHKACCWMLRPSLRLERAEAADTDHAWPGKIDHRGSTAGGFLDDDPAFARLGQVQCFEA